MGVFTIGLEKIEFGDIEEDGGLATSFAALGKTQRDSLTVSTEDPEITEFLSEESDTPEDTNETPGATTIDFILMDPDATVFEKLFGGTADGEAWSAPSQATKLEQSIKITPRKGLVYTFPRASVVTKLNASFGRTEVSGLQVTATVLQPTKEGESWLYIEPKA